MRLPAPFIKLPLRFDAGRLQTELAQFSEAEWRAHPQGSAGNSNLILVSHQGGENDDTSGAMAAAPRLARCPYLRQVIASFQTVVGRSRLMRLEPGAEVKPHSDTDFYWHDRVRIHVPIVTDSNVRFICDGVEVNMAEGEAWIFDNWRSHQVINGSGIRRVHLVIDTVGTAAFWRLASSGSIRGAGAPPATEPPCLPFLADVPGEFALEFRNIDDVAHPATVKLAVQEIRLDLQAGPRGPQEEALETALADFANQWQALWAMHGDTERGYSHYVLLIRDFLRHASQIAGNVRLRSNGVLATPVLQNYVRGFFGANDRWYRSLSPPLFDRPLFIVSAPRSGSTLLFEMLARHPDLYTLGDEGHAEVENIPGLSPRDRGYLSNALGAVDANAQVAAQLLRNFTVPLRDGRGRHWIIQEHAPVRVRFLEKTPKNALRIPFLNRIFPDALFIYLYRDSAPTLGSMLDAWASGRFVTYPNMPGWTGPGWSFLLPPGWQKLQGKSPAEIVAWQWQVTNVAILDSLAALRSDRWRVLDYETLLGNPSQVFRAVCEFIGVPPDADIERELKERGLPHSRYTLTAPAADKWRRHQAELDPVLPGTVELMQRLTAQSNRL